MKNDNSAATSRNQIARGFKLINWFGVDFNFDLGGGKYDKAIQWLHKEHDVINLVYDPYNRLPKYNTLSLAFAHLARTTTIFNVLNVINNPVERKEVLKFGKREKTRNIYISIHAGNKTGIGGPTRCGWQENRTLSNFLPEVQLVYPSAYIKKGIIQIDF